MDEPKIVRMKVRSVIPFEALMANLAPPSEGQGREEKEEKKEVGNGSENRTRVH